MNSQVKPQVWMTLTRMSYNVKLFLSKKLGHSSKRNIKLLGREIRSDFHHNKTTPHNKGCGFLLSLSVSILRSKILVPPKVAFQSKWQCAKSFGNYFCVNSWLWMWRALHSLLRICKTHFHTRLTLSLFQKQGRSSILDFIFNWLSRTKVSWFLCWGIRR